MDKMTLILHKLIDHTQEGRVAWHTTADPDGFLATVDTVGISISSLGKQSMVGEERYKVQILDREGRIAEVIETHDEYGLIPRERLASDEQAQAMESLFVLARRSALDVDATLDELVHQLDAIT